MGGPGRVQNDPGNLNINRTTDFISSHHWALFVMERNNLLRAKAQRIYCAIEQPREPMGSIMTAGNHLDCRGIVIDPLPIVGKNRGCQCLCVYNKGQQGLNKLDVGILIVT